jgi:hypothetical protein
MFLKEGWFVPISLCWWLGLAKYLVLSPWPVVRSYRILSHTRLHCGNTGHRILWNSTITYLFPEMDNESLYCATWGWMRDRVGSPIAINGTELGPPQDPQPAENSETQGRNKTCAAWPVCCSGLLGLKMAAANHRWCWPEYRCVLASGFCLAPGQEALSVGIALGTGTIRIFPVLGFPSLALMFKAKSYACFWHHPAKNAVFLHTLPPEFVVRLEKSFDHQANMCLQALSTGRSSGTLCRIWFYLSRNHIEFHI